MRTYAIRVTTAAALTVLTIVGTAISNPAFAGGVSGGY
jgi:hypothetical protein